MKLPFFLSFLPLHYFLFSAFLFCVFYYISDMILPVEASTTRGMTTLVYCLINSRLYTGTVHEVDGATEGKILAGGAAAEQANCISLISGETMTLNFL
jgi:hypothetical protein